MREPGFLTAPAASRARTRYCRSGIDQRSTWLFRSNEHVDALHSLRLLRAHSQRPSRRTAKERDERAPFHCAVHSSACAPKDSTPRYGRRLLRCEILTKLMTAVGHLQALPHCISNVRCASISRHTKSVLSAPPSGKSTAAFLRRLHRPDVHARVLAGEIGAHASMIDVRSNGCVSWENPRNLLKQNRPILHQLGKKPREINLPPGTHAPQQESTL